MRTRPNDDYPAYIAKCPKCGNLIMMTVDEPQMRDDNAKEIAACVRAGYTIERTTVGLARNAELCGCPEFTVKWEQPNEAVQP